MTECVAGPARGLRHPRVAPHGLRPHPARDRFPAIGSSRIDGDRPGLAKRRRKRWPGYRRPRRSTGRPEPDDRGSRPPARSLRRSSSARPTHLPGRRRLRCLEAAAGRPSAGRRGDRPEALVAGTPDPRPVPDRLAPTRSSSLRPRHPPPRISTDRQVDRPGAGVPRARQEDANRRTRARLMPPSGRTPDDGPRSPPEAPPTAGDLPVLGRTVRYHSRRRRRARGKSLATSAPARHGARPPRSVPGRTPPPNRARWRSSRAKPPAAAPTAGEEGGTDGAGRRVGRADGSREIAPSARGTPGRPFRIGRAVTAALVPMRLPELHGFEPACPVRLPSPKPGGGTGESPSRDGFRAGPGPAGRRFLDRAAGGPVR